MVVQQTSKEVYHRKVVPGLAARMREVYQALERISPATGSEVMAELNRTDPNAVRPCLTRLKQAGWIRPTGRRRVPQRGLNTVNPEIEVEPVPPAERRKPDTQQKPRQGILFDVPPPRL